MAYSCLNNRLAISLIIMYIRGVSAVVSGGDNNNVCYTTLSILICTAQEQQQLQSVLCAVRTSIQINIGHVTWKTWTGSDAGWICRGNTGTAYIERHGACTVFSSVYVLDRFALRYILRYKSDLAQETEKRQRVRWKREIQSLFLFFAFAFTVSYTVHT